MRKSVCMRKRNRIISIRVSDQEYDIIQKKLSETGLTQQAFILKAVEGAVISTAEDKKQLKEINLKLADLLKQIKGIGVNINQMAYRANAYRELPTVQKLSEYQNENEKLRREAETIWQSIRQLISQQKHMGQ